MELLRNFGATTPSLETVRFISSNILAFAPTSRGRDDTLGWNRQRDQTQQYSEFELLAFRTTQKIFFLTSNLLVTLDDDLFGTRACDNQVKTLSARKGDKEGHSADTVADALFRVLLTLRFWRQGEKNTDSVNNMLGSLLDGRSEEALNACHVTADRGYGKWSFQEIIPRHGLSCVMFMAEHLIECHPSVAKSFLLPCKEYELTDEECGEETISGHDGLASTVAPTENILPRGSDSVNEQNSTLPKRNTFDECNVNDSRLRYCPGVFVVDESPGLGNEYYCATKLVAGMAKKVRTDRMMAIAVREHGTEKYAKVLRFVYIIPNPLQKALHTWILVPKTAVLSSNVLFSGL
ncbi:hypothetical protein BWQ96_07692 [Gracilariopsis chorda]|uniref:Uncharacterized protein n=1 Tax=Gracilariopsis chorda TaxID=448386 RepID=A0A2V3IKJ3_9FLOR|nr:hypothetical protein BWQ96_07692 [Gracilariopsis chorda]|eukprot:PXF42597.1 hypothetical protein BWQ96_07692 [Gracilariopsis chorda]